MKTQKQKPKIGVSEELKKKLDKLKLVKSETYESVIERLVNRK